MKSKVSKKLSNIGISVMLPAVVFLVFVLLTGGDFANGQLILTVAKQTIIPMMIAMAMSMPMKMNMLDFSGGSIVYIGAIFGGNIAIMTGTGVVGMLIASIIIVVLFSAFSGALYNLLRVPSMVFSIGVTLIYEIVPRLVFKNGAAEIPMSWGALSQQPLCFIIFIVMFVLFYVVYNHMTLGHNVQAIGANQAIAFNAGVNITRTKFLVFVLGGLFLGVAGALYMASGIRVYAASSMSSISVIFDAMMGVFLANVLSRYSGFSMGLLIGTFTMRLLGTGLISFGLSSTVRAICSGLFLLVIMCYSTNQGRLGAFRARRKIAMEANLAANLPAAK